MLGFIFRRQAIIRGWIVDFWCPRLRLAIELDGHFHRTSAGYDYDRYRDEALGQLGIYTMRIASKRVFSDIINVLHEIISAIESQSRGNGNHATRAG